MKFENQLFHFFFYPFLIGILLSALIIISCSVIFTTDYIDKITGDNIIELGKDYSKINIDSINTIIISKILKIQLGLNELALNYEKISKKVISGDPNLNTFIDDNFLKCALHLDNTFNEQNEETYYMAYWFKDMETNLSDIKPNSYEENQLISFSNMIKNIFSNYYSSNMTSANFYFYFESTELYISFPLIYDFKNGFMSEIYNYTDNPAWCTDEKGEIYTIYKTKCRDFYSKMKKAKSNVFDLNYKDNVNRTIFITNFYKQAGTDSEIIFSMCIEFIDPISNKFAYMCSDINSEDLNYNLDNINSKLSGYFFINSVGLAHSFYFPQKSENALTITENVYEKEKKYFLEEKSHFSNNIQKLMTSNYIKYINDSLYEEIFTNGKNRNEQNFYINGEIFEFSIYPVVLDNYKGIKEHVLNIIYVYNNQLFYDEVIMKTNIGITILLELFTIFIFGSGLLYLIVLSFNTLSKYIVIPIKNVNYMLKGINIGGKNRLEYLKYLKIRQDDNAEVLEKLELDKYNKNNKDKINNDETKDDLKEDEENKMMNEMKRKKNQLIENSSLKENHGNTEQDNENNLDNAEYNDEIINSNINNYKKYEEENEFIEKESNFYNFNEELLEYRPLEINRLIKILIDLKEALLLTSTEQKNEKIINYSNSEEIFRSFKNNERTNICQSNIGNLQSQLLKYDKAIYHLVTSLQDNKLKKFLNKTLTDEYDDNDTLFNKISISFNMTKRKINNNVLIERQQNNSKNNFSQKTIGILINSRYNKLIHFYFEFFSLIQKLGPKTLNGQFMNTSFHNINHYHKIIIQYIYLCFVKNDLVKIGESILDYIEFLIKFKFKTSFENRHIFNIRNREYPEIKKKQKFKKDIFNKILNWFDLFDEYAFNVKNNTSLADEKSLIDDFSITSTDNNDFNSGSQSIFLFKVNLQRAEYLKGKFALICNNYTDALFYFIRAAKKESIVLDGLIKEKSLKRIAKIFSILFKKYSDYNIISLKMKEKISEFEKTKRIIHFNKKHKNSINITDINNIQEKKLLNDKNTFKKELMIIKNDIMNDLEECNVKQIKDIIIIIDLNNYNPEENNITYITKIDSFIEQTKTILDNYLSNNDRLATFIYKSEHQIICPLIEKNKIDLESFSKDLNYYKNIIIIINYFNIKYFNILFLWI